jgi:ElaB/YqjD/DUF883 family membrane-anchored ribosome-binding protein
MATKVSKAQKYIRKATLMSGRFTDYLQANPLVAVGLTLVVGTMAVAMSRRR